jgi:hypothetical protein
MLKDFRKQIAGAASKRTQSTLIKLPNGILDQVAGAGIRDELEGAGDLFCQFRQYGAFQQFVG